MGTLKLVASRTSLDPELQVGLNPSCLLAHHDDLVSVLGPAVYTPDEWSVRIGWQVVLEDDERYEVQLTDWKSRVQGGPREHEYFWNIGGSPQAAAALCRYVWDTTPNPPVAIADDTSPKRCPECGDDVHPGDLVVVDRYGTQVKLKAFKFYYKNLFPADVALADVEYPDRTSHLRMAQHLFPDHPDLDEIRNNLRQGKWQLEFP